MYISTSLVEKGSRHCLEEIFKEGNVDYLVKEEDDPEFPNLSLVESYDYSVFDETDMDAIIKELLRVKKEVSDPSDQEHIDDIIRLAERCKNTPNTILVFAG
jgi:hypothetical protein